MSYSGGQETLVPLFLSRAAPAWLPVPNGGFEMNAYWHEWGAPGNQTFPYDTYAHYTIEADDATYRRFGVIANNDKLYVQYTVTTTVPNGVTIVDA